MGPSLRQRFEALRAAGTTLLQTAAAAALAWLLAHDVLNHRSAFFAPIAAVIVIGLAPGKRTRRAVEIVLGVGVGIAVGDLLITAIGRGAGQVALVVLLAMAGAILVGGGPLVASQAAASAVLVATVPASAGGVVQTRFVDALVGGAVGLAVLAVAPRNPARMMHRAVSAVLAELVEVLEEIAAALEARDLDAARRALERARSSDALLAQLQNAVDLAQETVRLAPSQWRERARIERYATAARHAALAVRNTRVLARAGIRAVELEPRIPDELVSSLRSLALATRGLEAALVDENDVDLVLDHAGAAATEAMLALEHGGGFAIDVLVGQVRSTATDLLRAMGLDQDAAVRRIRAAAAVRSSR